MSKDSNTDTIHFPFINSCGNVGPGRSDFWSLSGPRGGRVCFTGGRRKLLVQGRWFWEPWIHNSVFARDKRLGFREHLVAIAWEPGSKPISPSHTFALSKRIKMSSRLSKLLAKFQYHISCLHHLFEFHVWHPESSPVNHSDIQFTRTDDLPPVCHFYLVLMSSLFFVIPDSSSLRSDIANYFKLSGRQFQFQLNLAFSADLVVENRGCSLSPEQFLWQLWVPFKKKFKLNFSLTSENTRWDHPCQDRSVLSKGIPVTHLMW